MPRRRRNRQSADSHLSERERTGLKELAADDRPLRRRRGAAGWGRRLMILLVLFLAGIAILPNLIGWTGMHQRMINWAAHDFAGQVNVQKLSAGWFQPVILQNVQALDNAGNLLFSAEKIVTSNRLASFLWSPDLGSVTIERPVINASIRDGGSNIEDAIAKYTAPSPGPPKDETGPLPKLQITVHDGTVNLVSANQPTVRMLSGIDATVQTGGASALTAQARLNNDASLGGGSLAVDATIDQNSSALEMANGDLTITAEKFDIAVLAPALERVFGKSQTAGILHGVVQANFSAQGNSVSANFGQTSMQGFRLSAEHLFGPDELVIEKLVASGQATMDSKGVAADALSLASEIGELRAHGQLAWQQLTRLISNGQLAAAKFQLDGGLDIARLASMLPATLTLHEDLVFESGQLNFSLTSRDDAGIPRIIANVDTLNLAARRGGERIVWAQPLRFVTTIAQRDGQTLIEDLLCESDFLKISGAGSLGSAKFTTTGDLDKLMQRLRQFATLDGWQLAGTVQGDFVCQAESGNAVATSAAELLGRPIQISGDITIANPVIQLPGVAAWVEPELRTVLNATAQANSGGAVSIREGMAQILLGSDVATVRLIQPVADIYTTGSLSVEAAATGQLERWTGLVKNFADIGTFRTAGQGTVSATLVADAQQITVSNLQYQFDQFTFDGYGMAIQEDQVSGTGGMQYILDSGTLTADNLTLVSSSVAAVAQQASISCGPHLAATGQIALRGDVHRIAGWFGMSDPEDTIQYFGNLEGTIGLSSTGEFINGRLSATVSDLVVVRPDYQAQKWVELHREPVVNIAGDLGLAQSFNDMKLTAVKIQASSVSAGMDGMIRDLAGAFEMELDGNWTPDWQKIDGLVAAYSGNMVTLSGRDQQTFSVRGPLFAVGANTANATPILPAATLVTTEIKWDRGNVFLLPVGAAKIQAGLAGSVVKINTGEIPFGGGTVTVQPEIDLASASPVITMAPGNIATQIQLTPEFCRDWMKYVAPLLADATTAQGSFSVTSGGVAVPLDNFSAATASGTVTLHNVTVGAGPLAQQLLGTVESVRSLLKPDADPVKDRSVWMNLGEQEIPFVVRDGRVFHDGLQLQLKDMHVTTSGSVGMDQSLSMVATIPIHDDWLNGQKWLEGLRGQKLEIPVSGTVSKPVLDKRAIQQLTSQLGQRVAQQVIGDQTAKLQEKAAGEINQFQEKMQGKVQDKVEGLQNKVQEKLQGEVFKGLNNLFGPKPPAGNGG